MEPLEDMYVDPWTEIADCLAEEERVFQVEIASRSDKVFEQLRDVFPTAQWITDMSILDEKDRSTLFPVEPLLLPFFRFA